MGYYAAVLLALVTSRVDYLPGANRPWAVDWPGRAVGRGRTLAGAIRDLFRKG